eukprot:4678192-Ditylum_brightwellii.AAC.1
MEGGLMMYAFLLLDLFITMALLAHLIYILFVILVLVMKLLVVIVFVLVDIVSRRLALGLQQRTYMRTQHSMYAVY